MMTALFFAVPMVVAPLPEKAKQPKIYALVYLGPAKTAKERGELQRKHAEIIQKIFDDHDYLGRLRVEPVGHENALRVLLENAPESKQARIVNNTLSSTDAVFKGRLKRWK
jgi:hypothetical protein